MPSNGESELLMVDGHEVAISNPGEGALPSGGPYQAGPGALLPRRGRWRRFEAPAGGRTCSCATRTASTASSSIRSVRRSHVPTGSKWSLCKFPSGRTAEEVVPRRRRGARVDGQPGLSRAAPASGACRGSRPSGRAARRSRSGARASSGRRCARSRRWSARRSTISGSSAGRRRRARAACTSTCASSALDVRRGPARGAGAGARGRAARAGLATSKWWKEERHGVFIDYNQNAKDRTVAAAYSVRPKPDARVSAPLTWDEIDAAILPTSPWRRCRRGSRRSATATPGSIATPCSLERCSSCRRATRAKGSATRRGRRNTRSSRANRHGLQPSRRRDAEAPADRDRAGAEEGGRAGGLERWRLVIPKRRRTSNLPMSSSMRCAAAFTRGRASASICSTSRRSSARRRKPSTRTILRRTLAASRAATGRADGRQVLASHPDGAIDLATRISRSPKRRAAKVFPSQAMCPSR